jgi:nucleotide-binding universal stress UspA family protein
MYRVLIPVDTSEERALAQAEYVTSLPNAAESVEAYLLFVFTEDSDDLPQEFETFKSASRIGSVRRAQEALEDAGIEVTILEDSGDTEDDILEEAGAYDVDSIVLGGRKRSPVGKAIFGSTTQGIILSSDRPVVVTGGGGEE